MIATAAQMRYGVRPGAAESRGLLDRGKIIDLFAGGGGASHGFEKGLKRSPDDAVNHDINSVTMHSVNHPHTQHHCRGVFDRESHPLVVAAGYPVEVVWGSPDCTDFSSAKGNKPSNRKSRCLCWALVLWAYHVRQRVTFMENVREFQNYAPLKAEGPPRDWRDADHKDEKRRNDVVDLENTAWTAGTFDSRGRRVTGGTIKRRPIERPDPEKKGALFNLFVASLRSLGYAVEWRVQNCADFGDATVRRRLFLIARCDGQPIVWPKHTHGDAKARKKDPSLKPWRPVSECIDWDLPTTSIFDRKRPLAENTLRRIGRGVGRYVLETSDPFLVELNHGGDEFRGRRVDDPASTITQKTSTALCSPSMVQLGYGERRGQAPRTLDINAPLGTAVGGNKFGQVAAFLAKHYGGVVGHDLNRPLGTVTATDHHSLVSATIVRHCQNGSNGGNVQSVDAPLSTVVSKAEHSLVSATLVGVGGAGYSGKPKPVDVPASTVLPQDHRAVASACMVRMNRGDESSNGAAEPLRTVTSGGGKHALAASCMVRMNHGDKQWNSVRDPQVTITSQGNKAGLVAAFLVKYYGSGVPTLVTDPSGTITSKSRFGLVTVKMVEQVVTHADGTTQEITTDTPAVAVNIPGRGWYIIVDICLRMLSPRELARCHSFPENYILTGSIANQIARIGNSVPVETVAAHVVANVPELRRERLPGRRRLKRQEAAVSA